MEEQNAIMNRTKHLLSAIMCLVVMPLAMLALIVDSDAMGEWTEAFKNDVRGFVSGKEW
jgi:putative copper export protein